MTLLRLVCLSIGVAATTAIGLIIMLPVLKAKGQEKDAYVIAVGAGLTYAAITLYVWL